MFEPGDPNTPPAVRDGQITVGDTVMKAHATKVRALKGGKILAAFAGAARRWAGVTATLVTRTGTTP